MKEKTSLLLLALILAASGFSVGVTCASIATSDPPTDEFMMENADIIVICKVTNVDVGVHNTDYMFETEEAVKGVIQKVFMITTADGTNRHTEPPAVRFEDGQEYIVYLSEEDGKYSVFFGEWGKTLLSAFNEELLDNLRSSYRGTIELDVPPVFFIFLLFLSCVLVYYFWTLTNN